LITVKGLRCLRMADVVVYDRLIDPALLNEARPDAECIFVGKGPGYHTRPQAQINVLLIAHARRGRVVVRLKGGDPFVFGRGGEEAAALAAAGIPFEVVPGVSSAIAVPAYAGIPVTHRGHGSLMTVVTAHECDTPHPPPPSPSRGEGAPGAASPLSRAQGEGLSASLGVRAAPPLPRPGRGAGGEGATGVDWEALARVGGTLIIMMGVAALPRVTQRLCAGGLAPDTPAAVIERGTTAQQRVVEGTLADIAGRAAAAGIRPPATTVVGAVAALRASLAWFATASRQRTADDRGARHSALDW
jgi:siroheme synthase